MITEITQTRVKCLAHQLSELMKLHGRETVEQAFEVARSEPEDTGITRPFSDCKRGHSNG